MRTKSFGHAWTNATPETSECTAFVELPLHFKGSVCITPYSQLNFMHNAECFAAHEGTKWFDQSADVANL
jgi:hypothetical protein